jgi:hypothetical protein
MSSKAEKRFERNRRLLEKAAGMIAEVAVDRSMLYTGIDISKALFEAYACKAFEKRALGHGRGDTPAADSSTEEIL